MEPKHASKRNDSNALQSPVTNETTMPVAKETLDESPRLFRLSPTMQTIA